MFLKKILSVFKDLKTQYIFDYKHNRLTLILEVIGTLSAIIASITVAYWGNNANMLIAFSSYFLSSITWLAAGIRRSNSFLIILNLCFTMINMVGLYNAIVGQ